MKAKRPPEELVCGVFTPATPYSLGIFPFGADSLSFFTHAVACRKADLLINFRTGPGTEDCILTSQA